MMRRTTTISALVFAVVLTSEAQLRITKVEKLPLSTSQEWAYPRFSPDGKRVYFTAAQGNGIWVYSPQSRATRQITVDAKSGSSFNISPDGNQIVYRRSVWDRKTKTRKQEVVLKNLSTGSSRVLASGPDVSVPVFSQDIVLYSIKGETKNLASIRNLDEVSILGIEETKIALVRNGKKVLLDPLGKGSYIWPSLSPDKKLIVAYDMDQGSFVCDLDGNIISKLGRRDAAVWTRSGKWILYMVDRDDGYRILSSDLYAISPDGVTVTQLTATEEVMEMHPQCSPTENKIVYSTLGGEIYLLRYEER